MPALIDMVGRRYARLEVIRRSQQTNSTGAAFWLCRCDCGNEVETSGIGLRRGTTRSCGCLHITHGMTLSPEYRVWSSMHQRCTNPKHIRYANYGGRGISVCERWNKFEMFFSDMGRRPAGLTLERVNNDEGYNPANCKWATLSEQNRNRRKRT